MRLFRSLHARMMAIAAAATLAALVVAGVAMAGLLGQFVIEGLDRRLDAEAALLASVVDGAGRIDRDRLAARAGALEAGPGWRWRIEAPGGTLGSGDFPVLDAPGPHPPGPGPDREMDRPRPLDGRDDDGGAVHARRLTFATSGGPVTITTAAPRGLASRPVLGAVAPLALALAAVAAILTLALAVQLRLGLRPVARLRAEVAAIRAGTRARVAEDQPDELRPLAAELNALAADTERALATARGSAANLAHALKTPVAALAIELADDPRRAAIVARIDRTIRHHLSRARAAAIDRRTATPLAPAVREIVDTVLKLHCGRALSAAVAIDERLSVAVDAQDLDELIGNIVDNAARHAATRIAVRAAAEGRRVAIAVADDGPGIPAEARARVTAAGERLDEAGDGHGFGLAITAELASLYGGSLSLGEAIEGGLLVTIVLPAAG